ncbi:transcriptional regulator GcvA [Phenylobacterium deserti]|uniref:Transcriptional regulator n=1 Tax=Phenylobacterium deserti TaxID=1914756 RepID=A0A328AQP0_9CAUL|nr:transcriptional regulator GcvA [Phenylobacterium deserti]RAK57330.1 transcriptional regulator [Phenylobacterium deserti]
MARLPLTGLRVLEAAARHGSFQRAAEELAITPGAVSRQIKTLEADLGLRLFERFNRRVRLTEEGARLAEGVRRGLGVIQEAVDEARERRPGPLVVTTMHSFAAKWLVPRLHRFNERYRDVQVLVLTADEPADLHRDRIDVAIRFGRGPYPDLQAFRLMETIWAPVCSPELRDRLGLHEPADLQRAMLLADVMLGVGEPGWREWLDAAGAPHIDVAIAQSFTSTYLATEAALAGRGVALAQLALVADELRSARLVRPFDLALHSPYAYWVLSLPEKADQPAVRRFRNWLTEEAQADGLLSQVS